jgi:hypothetical protein
VLRSSVVREASYGARVSALQHPHRARRASRREPVATVVCAGCGVERSFERVRLEAWQISRDGERFHCAPCSALHVITLDDQVLYWPACGHAEDDDIVLYARPVCVICDD